MRLAENESRLVGMKFEALVELSREAEGLIPRNLLRNLFSKLALGFIPVILSASNSLYDFLLPDANK
jgi:hypothetical protein